MYTSPHISPPHINLIPVLFKVRARSCALWKEDPRLLRGSYIQSLRESQEHPAGLKALDKRQDPLSLLFGDVLIFTAKRNSNCCQQTRFRGSGAQLFCFCGTNSKVNAVLLCLFDGVSGLLRMIENYALRVEGDLLASPVCFTHV